MTRDSKQLPHGWAQATLEDLLDPLEDGRLIHQGWSPQCEEGPARADGEWGVLKTTAVQVGEFLPQHNKRLPPSLRPRPVLEVKSGDLLITAAGRRIWCGVPCLVRHTRPHLMISGKMYRFRVSERLLDPAFVEAQLCSSAAHEAIDAIKTGAIDASLNLTHERFRRLSLVVAPLPEQRRIVSAIESYFTRLDEAVAGLERVQRNLARYRASVLQAAVEGRLVPTEASLARAEGRSYEPASILLSRILSERRRLWEESELARLRSSGKPRTADAWNSRYAEPMPPDATQLPPLPEGWCWATLDALADITGGLTKGMKRSQATALRAVPYLRVANVQRGHLNLTEVKEIAATDDEVDALRLRPGDVLLNEGGDRDKLGRGWVWSGELPECIHQNHVFRARIYTADVIPKYLSWYGNTVGQRYFFDEGKQTTNLASINKTKLKALPVAVPPFEEQSRIAAEVERLDSVREERRES